MADSEVRQKFEACVMCVTGKSEDGIEVKEVEWTHIRGSYSWRHPLVADRLMSIECTCPGFEDWANSRKNGGTVSLRNAFSAGIAWQAKQTKRAEFEAGMRAGEIAMREKAADLASDLWEADDNPCASPVCAEIPAAIRALPLSGAEESKK